VVQYTGCAKKFYRQKFSDNFSKTTKNFLTKFYTPIIEFLHFTTHPSRVLLTDDKQQV